MLPLVVVAGAGAQEVDVVLEVAFVLVAHTHPQYRRWTLLMTVLLGRFLGYGQGGVPGRCCGSYGPPEHEPGG